MTPEHEALLERVAALVERAHWLRRDYGESGTAVTPASLAVIVVGALVAVEGGDLEVAKTLLAGYLAQYAEDLARSEAALLALASAVDGGSQGGASTH